MSCDRPSGSHIVQVVPSANDVISRMNERLTRAEMISRESEGIATEALDELALQRELLARTRDRIGETNRELNSTNKILKSIYRRVATNKLLLGIIILMEMVIIGCQLYLKFFKK